MSSTSHELQPLELLSGNLLRPLGAFEEHFCRFDQHFPTNGALAAQITGHTTVQQWRYPLDAVQQRHPLLLPASTFNRVPHFRCVISQRIRVVHRLGSSSGTDSGTDTSLPSLRSILLNCSVAWYLEPCEITLSFAYLS